MSKTGGKDQEHTDRLIFPIWRRHGGPGLPQVQAVYDRYNAWLALAETCRGEEDRMCPWQTCLRCWEKEE